MSYFPESPVDGDTYTTNFGDFIYDSARNAWFPYPTQDPVYSAFGVVSTYKVLTLAEGPVQSITLTASTTCEMSLPLPTYGGSFQLLVKQPAVTGNGVVTWFGVVWPAGTTPTLTATAGRADLFTFTSDGVKWYGRVNQNYVW